jgi:hypothetical protein
MKKNSWSNLSPEQRQQRAASMAERGKKRWMQLSPEEQQAVVATFRAAMPLPVRKKKPRCECGVMTLDSARRLAATTKIHRTHKEGCSFYQTASERSEIFRAKSRRQWAMKTPEQRTAWALKVRATREANGNSRKPRCGCGAMTLTKALRLAATQKICQRHKPECPFYRPPGRNYKPPTPAPPIPAPPIPALEQPSPDSVRQWRKTRRREQ